MLKKINDYMYKISDIKFILIMLIVSYLIIIPLEPIIIFIRSIYGESDGPTNIKAMSFLGQMIKLSLIAPFFETLFFQRIPIELMQKKDFFKSKPCLIILISAFLFAVTHYYDIAYIVVVFPIGLILAYSYIIYQKKESKLTAFKVVFIIHMLRNTVSLLINTFYFT